MKIKADRNGKKLDTELNNSQKRCLGSDCQDDICLEQRQTVSDEVYKIFMACWKRRDADKAKKTTSIDLNDEDSDENDV